MEVEECIVCFESKTLLCCEFCPQKICLECWRNHFTSQTGQGYTCFDPNCKQGITWMFLTKIYTSKNEQTQIKENLRDYLMLQSKSSFVQVQNKMRFFDIVRETATLAYNSLCNFYNTSGIHLGGYEENEFEIQKILGLNIKYMTTFVKKLNNDYMQNHYSDEDKHRDFKYILYIKCHENRGSKEVNVDYILYYFFSQLKKYIDPWSFLWAPFITKTECRKGLWGYFKPLEEKEYIV